MNLVSTILAYGTSEGASRAWDTRGRGRTKHDSDKVARALASYVPQNKNKVKVATMNEALVAKLLGGTQTTFKHPFDVLVNKGKIAIEVKTVFPGVRNSKITQHPASLERKADFLDEGKYKKAYTVIFDMRDHSTYVAKGLGSFRFDRPGNVEQVSLKKLSSIIN